MTNHWIDLQNSDCLFMIGSNPAENHPICFKWVIKAQEKGATVVHMDPRFTRTAAKADIFASMRSGSDIAILGGLIKYILDNNLHFEEYVSEYTNAGFLVNEDYAFEDGVFSGLNKDTGKYDKSTWTFQMDENGIPLKDRTLQDPNCVFQLLKKHYERYDLDTVAQVSGCPKEDLLKVFETFAATGKPDKTGTFMYAMGQTQHTTGVQNVRAMAIIQLLLGNTGMAGGGINALRGESNVQGSTDHCLLVHILPGYLGTPQASMQSFEAYNKAKTPVTQDPDSANWWSNYPKYSASLLKAMWPEQDLETGYSYLPKLEDGKNYTWLNLFEAMANAEFSGFFAWGQNPACGGANAQKNRLAFANLDWMVNVNIFDNETGSFWKGPGMEPKNIKTEVFFLPCAVSIEKEGSVTNSGRWMQWRYAGPDMMGETTTDGHMICHLLHELKRLYKEEGGAYPDPILNLDMSNWETDGEFDPHKVAKLINGYFLKDVEIKGKVYKKGTLVPSFAFLQADGSTSSGNWLYCNSYTEEGNKSERRDKTQTDMQANIGLYPNWTWCWPVNRRIIYNRASVDQQGKPWAPQKAVIEWTGDKWVGDVPDGGWEPGTKHPFIMKPEGHGHVFGPGRADGPFPEYYEPLECPIAEHPFSPQLHNPTALQFITEMKAVCDPRYPFVCSTYRVTEHWQSGVMTRWTPWLLETEPQMFVEMSPELAELRGIQNGDKCTVESVRGSLWAIAIVTKRVKAFDVMGQTIHQVGIPWHYGWVFPKDGGDAANLLTPSVGDPNTGIPETKAFMVNVKKA